MSDIDDLMLRDHTQLTEADMEPYVEYYRKLRGNQGEGQRAKGSGKVPESKPVDLVALGTIKAKPVIKRRV